MPRYYFNIYNGEQIFDEAGTELADYREVRLHMISTALALFEDDAHQNHKWELEAVDQSGRIVSTMTFGIETADK